MDGIFHKGHIAAGGQPAQGDGEEQDAGDGDGLEDEDGTFFFIKK